MTEAKIFSCTQSRELAINIADKFGIPMGNVTFSHYSDGEFQPSFEESVRGSRVFIIGSTHPSSDFLILDGRDKIAKTSQGYRLGQK